MNVSKAILNEGKISHKELLDLNVNDTILINDDTGYTLPYLEINNEKYDMEYKITTKDNKIALILEEE